ncbi:MAG TPA: DUF2934 domain-containing protein [Tepidisphaeraceae bacterium]|nr:DUF2934 domain-containing protein [Tepidisphaeraceae bacterium]
MKKKTKAKPVSKSHSRTPAKVVKTTPARNTPLPKAATPVTPIPAAPPAAVAPKEITYEMIAKRAYEIFAGGTGGDETSNWLRAERELRGL